MSPEYSMLSGTVIGEVHNEVFVTHGSSIYETAHYGWHHTQSDDLATETMYTLVNSTPVQMLKATATHLSRTEREKLLKNAITVTPEGNATLPDPSFIRSLDDPISLHLEWYEPNIPFITKQEADSQNLSYPL
jgi:methionine synthase I (cobalamin-dependent)